MKVAKNMDSVFDNSRQDELEFEVFFDEDDCLIDAVAGVNEAGELYTGPDPEEVLYQKDGDAAYDLKDAEGVVDKKPEIGGEVGDGKEVSGKENSAESKAHDDTKEVDQAIGLTDKKQTSLESGEIAQCNGDCESVPSKAENPIEEDDAKERAGEEVPVGVIATESDEAEVDIDIKDDNNNQADPGDTDEATNESVDEMDIDIILSEEFEVAQKEDEEARNGKVDPDDVKNVEGVKQEVIDKETKGEANKDAIKDTCDTAARDGKAPTDTQDVEGVSTKVIGAALEANDNVDDLINDDDELVDIVLSDEVVPDSIRDSGSANEIKPDRDNANSKGVSESEEVMYKGWRKVTEAVNPSDLVEDDELDIDIDEVNDDSYANDIKYDDDEDDDLINIAMNDDSL